MGDSIPQMNCGPSLPPCISCDNPGFKIFKSTHHLYCLCHECFHNLPTALWDLIIGYTRHFPVFVLLTARDCRHCPDYLENPSGWNITKEALENTGLHVVHIDFPSMRSGSIPEAFPRDLNRYAQWFPSMMMFDWDNWEEAMSLPRSSSKPVKLHGMALGGEIGEDGVLRYRKNENYREKGNVLRWVREVISQGKLGVK